MALSAVKVNKGTENYLRIHGKQMSNAVVFLVRMVSKDYKLFYEKPLQPYRLTNPFIIPLHNGNCILG